MPESDQESAPPFVLRILNQITRQNAHDYTHAEAIDILVSSEAREHTSDSDILVAAAALMRSTTKEVHRLFTSERLSILQEICASMAASGNLLPIRLFCETVLQSTSHIDFRSFTDSSAFAPFIELYAYSGGHSRELIYSLLGSSDKSLFLLGIRLLSASFSATKSSSVATNGTPFGNIPDELLIRLSRGTFIHCVDLTTLLLPPPIIASSDSVIPVQQLLPLKLPGNLHEVIHLCSTLSRFYGLYRRLLMKAVRLVLSPHVGENTRAKLEVTSIVENIVSLLLKELFAAETLSSVELLCDIFAVVSKTLRTDMLFEICLLLLIELKSIAESYTDAFLFTVDKGALESLPLEALRVQRILGPLLDSTATCSAITGIILRLQMALYRMEISLNTQKTTFIRMDLSAVLDLPTGLPTLLRRRDNIAKIREHLAFSSSVGQQSVLSNGTLPPLILAARVLSMVEKRNSQRLTKKGPAQKLQ